MGTEKRERQKANRAAKLEHETKIQKRSRLRERLVLGAVTLAVVALGLYLLSRGGDDTTDAAGTATTAVDATTAPTSTVPDQPVSAVVQPEPGASITGETPCPAEDGSAERTTSFEQAPPTCIDTAATYTAEVTTNLGAFTIALDAEAAPLAVNNFVVLARYHYYDGANFHRIIPGFVIQGGDPVGLSPGTGGPGYSFADELPAEGDYQLGSVAMANSGPDTNGSQFFVIIGDQGTALPPNYSLFGSVTDGMDVVDAIGAIPTTPADAPTEPAVIESVTITEG